MGFAPPLRGGREVSLPQIAGDGRGLPMNGQTFGGIPFLFCWLDTSQCLNERRQAARVASLLGLQPLPATPLTSGLPNPRLRTYPSFRSAPPMPRSQLPYPRIPAPRHSGGVPFSNPLPHNGHTRRLTPYSTVTFLGFSLLCRSATHPRDPPSPSRRDTPQSWPA